MRDLNWEIVDSPLGELAVVASEAGIARIAWDFDDPEAYVFNDLDRLGADAAQRGWTPLLEAARDQLAAWFAGDITDFDLPLSPDPRSGDAFSQRVLTVTASIPRGETMTYGEVAREAGNPRGARAAGNALGANTIPIIVPCHRVVAANGIGGFGGGTARKLVLLAVESG